MKIDAELEEAIRAAPADELKAIRDLIDTVLTEKTRNEVYATCAGCGVAYTRQEYDTIEACPVCSGTRFNQYRRYTTE